MLINKGSSENWSFEELRASENALGFKLISVLRSIEQSWEGGEKDNQIKDRYKGLVRESSFAMYHDLHGLAIMIDLIQDLFRHRKEIMRHKHFLYVSEIVEKYFSNLRSIYDYIAKVLRLAVNRQVIGQIPFDSLNDLIKYAENDKSKGKLPKNISDLLVANKKEFEIVRDIRDSLIHNGKMIDIVTDNSGYHLVLDKTIKPGDAFDTPLLQYLSDITIKMLDFGEKIGEYILEEYTNTYGEFQIKLVALEGVCIPSFIKFLNCSSEPENNA